MHDGCSVLSKSLVCVHTFALWEKKKKKKAGKCGRVAKREGNIYSRDAPSRYDSYNNRELMPFHPSTASFFSFSLLLLLLLMLLFLFSFFRALFSFNSKLLGVVKA